MCVNYQLATLNLTLDDASEPRKIVFLLVFQLFPACSYVAKICGSLVGASVRPNVLNMLKSASGLHSLSLGLRILVVDLHSRKTSHL